MSILPAAAVSWKCVFHSPQSSPYPPLLYSEPTAHTVALARLTNHVARWGIFSIILSTAHFSLLIDYGSWYTRLTTSHLTVFAPRFPTDLYTPLLPKCGRGPVLHPLYTPPKQHPQLWLPSPHLQHDPNLISRFSHVLPGFCHQHVPFSPPCPHLAPWLSISSAPCSSHSAVSGKKFNTHPGVELELRLLSLEASQRAISEPITPSSCLIFPSFVCTLLCGRWI